MVVICNDESFFVSLLLSPELEFLGPNLPNNNGISNTILILVCGKITNFIV
jgi:hypothetical protein